MSLRRDRNLIGGISSKVLMLISASLLSLCYLAIVVNPVKAWILSIFGLLFFPIAGLNAILFCWSAFRLSKNCLIPLLILLPSLIFTGRYIQLSSSAAEKSDSDIKILSYNVGQFVAGNGGKMPYAECMNGIMEMISEEKPDIVCLQEVYFLSNNDVRDYFKKKFPGFNLAYYFNISPSGSKGNVTLSKFPIIEKGKFDFEKSANMAIFANILVGKDTLRVYNCHFQSYSVSIANLVNVVRKNKTEAKETEARIKKSIKIRPQQVDLIMDDIDENGRSAIVAGDFNDNPMSYTYNRLTKGRKDTFIEAGKGFGATFSALWPLIRIDYILYPKRGHATSHKVEKMNFSDHYPVVAEINFD